MGAALGEQVVAGAALHHPEMGPAAPQQAARLATAQGFLHPQQVRQLLLGFGPLPVAAAAGAQQHLAGAATEALNQGPALAAGGKGQLHLGLAQVQARLQGLHGRARGRGPQEQAAVQGLHQGAFAGLVGAADQGQARAEVQGQVAMDADVLQAAGEQAHGGKGRPGRWCRDGAGWLLGGWIGCWIGSWTGCSVAVDRFGLIARGSQAPGVAALSGSGRACPGDRPRDRVPRSGAGGEPEQFAEGGAADGGGGLVDPLLAG